MSVETRSCRKALLVNWTISGWMERQRTVIARRSPMLSLYPSPIPKQGRGFLIKAPMILLNFEARARIGPNNNVPWLKFSSCLLALAGRQKNEIACDSSPASHKSRSRIPNKILVCDYSESMCLLALSADGKKREFCHFEFSHLLEANTRRQMCFYL